MSAASSKSPKQGSRSAAVIATVVPLVVVAVIGVYFWMRDSRVTIGVEGQRVVEIAGPRLQAAPFTPGDAVGLRIAEAVPTDAGYRYDLRYILYGPGEYDLATYLRRDADAQAGPIPALPVSVDSILPEDHGGELFDAPPSPINLHSNYSLAMRLLWGLWALLLVPLVLLGRRRRVVVEMAPPPPTVAERLRELLERASSQHLTAGEQADLEQLLLAFWSKRLNLDATTLNEAIEALRADPTAGRQLAGVERWLHSPRAPANGEVARELLKDLNAAAPAEFRLPKGVRRA